MDPDKKRLLDKGILVLHGEVNESMFVHAKESLLYLTSAGMPDITVSICSNGGSVDFGLDIYDLLALYPSKKTGQVVSQASSMGAIILQACNWRTISPHATVLIHYVSRKSVTLNTLTDPEKLAGIIADMQKLQDALEAILVKRTGKTLSEIRDECAKDKSMSAGQAVDFGLADEVITFKHEAAT